jgi:hypothetical protein
MKVNTETERALPKGYEKKGSREISVIDERETY